VYVYQQIQYKVSGNGIRQQVRRGQQTTASLINRRDKKKVKSRI